MLLSDWSANKSIPASPSGIPRVSPPRQERPRLCISHRGSRLHLVLRTCDLATPIITKTTHISKAHLHHQNPTRNYCLQSCEGHKCLTAFLVLWKTSQILMVESHCPVTISCPSGWNDTAFTGL